MVAKIVGVTAMRLSDFEKNVIVSTVRRFDSNSRIYLFGSRTDNSKKGGDIDLLIMSAILTRDDKRSIKSELYERIGEQKIDIVLSVAAEEPFVKLVLETGVEL